MNKVSLKNNGRREPDMFYIAFHCYCLNQARTGPECYLCRQAFGPYRCRQRHGIRAVPVQAKARHSGRTGAGKGYVPRF
jgi:hypothetical protein